MDAEQRLPLIDLRAPIPGRPADDVLFPRSRRAITACHFSTCAPPIPGGQEDVRTTSSPLSRRAITACRSWNCPPRPRRCNHGRLWAWAGMGTRSVKKKGGEGRNVAESLFLPLDGFVEPGSTKKISDLWALRERVGVTFLVGGIFNFFGSL